MSRAFIFVGLLIALIRLAWAGPLWMETFPVYPGAVSLCEQHVTGNSGHILWHSYTSTDDSAKVRAFYARKMKPEKNQPSELTVRVGDHLLAVYPASSTDYPTCGKTPPADARTVIIVSQFVKTK